MAKQGITTGSAPNDGTGDTLLAGAVKINSNFNELYTYLGNGSNLNYIGGRWSNTNVGISTLSNVGIGTTNPTSALTVTGDGKVTGVVTATTFVGNVTGNVTGNVVGGVTGNVTGTASTAQGLTGTPTISVADITASGKVSAGGSVTGASIHGSTIHGNGNALTGIVTFINPGTNISVSANQGYVTINASSSGGQGYFTKNVTGINTSSNVGIGTTTADHTLTVAGVTSTTNLSVTGLSTFTGKVEGSATNNVLPFLYSNYADLPSATTYHGAFAHVHATQKAYYAHGGNWSELVNREQTGVVGTGTDQYNIGITSVTTLTATTVSASSTITASKFVGDGSGITGVTASGTGIIIKNDGSTIGTAGTIDFGTALSVTAISGAAVTVTASTPNNLTPATLVVSGVSTFSGNIKNASDSAGTYWGAGDDLLIKHNGGDSVITNSNAGRLSIQNTVEGQTIEIEPKGNVEINRYGGAMYAEFKDGNSVDLYFNGSKKFETSNEGSITSGITSTTTLEVNNRYGVSTGFGTFTAQAGVAHTINQFTIASDNFKSAEYTVHIERENTQQVQKVLVMQNGSTAYSSEYGIIYNPSLIASIGANVASGVMKLEVTPETGQTGLTTYRFTRETMK